MRKSKLFLILLAGAALLVAGCSFNKDNPGSSPSSSNSSSKDIPVTIKIFSQFMPSDEIDNGYFTKFLEKKFNVKFEWNAATRVTFEEKKKLVMANGDYPDIFMGEGFFTKQEQMLYGQGGILEPLNDWIETYGVNIKSYVLPKFPDFLTANTAPDGKIYGLPSINVCYHCLYSHKMWINTTWLEKLGLHMPTTTDEFYQVLKAFKNQDPNGNGIADEIPLSGTDKGWNANVDGFIMNAFIYDDSFLYLQVKDGKVDFVPNKPEWREGLEYLNKLYREGLLDKNAFIQDSDALGSIGMNPEIALLGAFPNGVSTAVVWPDAKGSTRPAEYQGVPPLKGPNGVQLAVKEAEQGPLRVWSSFSISTSSKHKELAMQIADYLYSEEGTIGAQRGREGVDWRKAEAGEVGLEGNPAEIAILRSGSSWNNMGPHTVSKEFRESEAVPQDPNLDVGNELKWFQTTKKYEPYAPKENLPPMFMDPQEITKLSQIQSDITRYVKDSMVKFILGEQNFAEDWDKYVSNFNNLKLEPYMSIYQKAYDKKL